MVNANMSDPAPQLWSSKYVFLLAAIGSAVGLANMWKFPYTVGTQGGGAFILIYLLAVLFIATPILMAELVIGRRGRMGPATSVERVAIASGASPNWKNVSILGVLAAFLTLGFYFVIAGWTVFYSVESLRGGFIGADAAYFQQTFDQFIGSPVDLTLYMTIFTLIAAIPVALGIHNGIERCVKSVMPVFFVMLVFTCGVSMVQGDLAATIDFMFVFDLAQVKGETIMYAIGQAFFSVGVGACVLIVFGAHLPKDVSIAQSALIVAGVDTLVALASGLTIFPIVFAQGFDPAEGPGLMFVALPAALSGFHFGSILSTLFFVMLLIATLTSAIAIALPPVEWLKNKFSVNHVVATLVIFTLEWAMGLTVVLSFNKWSDFFPLAFIPLFEKLTFFGIYEMVAANIAMPVGGILLSLFVGWKMSPAILRDELNITSNGLMLICQNTYRYVIPCALIGVALLSFYK